MLAYELCQYSAIKAYTVRAPLPKRVGRRQRITTVPPARHVSYHVIAALISLRSYAQVRRRKKKKNLPGVGFEPTTSAAPDEKLSVEWTMESFPLAGGQRADHCANWAVM